MQPELHVDPSIYMRKFPRFERPTIIGYIGLENLKYARHVGNRRVHYDLNLHYDKAIHRPADLDVKITELLKFLLEHETRLNFPLETSLRNAKFFCYRGLLTCIACTPYENREPWKIVAILHKGNIYLCARDTEEKISRKMNMTERDKLFTSWGYKFEQYLLSDEPDVEPNPDVPVDENEEFSLVFKTQLNKHTIVFGAEMDGIRCDKTRITKPPTELGPEGIIQYLANKEFIELKTNRHIENGKQENSFRRFKAKKWWCQSFLVGIDKILCGYRDDNGIVEELRICNVGDLPRKSQRFWNSDVCFNFIDDFLVYVKRCLSRKIKHKYGEKALDDLQALPLMTLMFEWTPGMPVHVTENYSHDDDPILLPWFLNNYGKVQKSM
ncbi:decapping and exoribonuclease protein-like [Trichoplusia ni]|uniref:Decapping nuclease n=1 Tax=Trichoplusia ni TaxID=7111 RepID=A0A7E5VGF6_TRINI|nr:decapping and exoribonuclease protein-like [Trichoplusia ni]